MQSIKRISQKFVYVTNFFNDRALAILKPNIFGVSRIVRIDTNYKITNRTKYFTFNNWFNGYLIVYEINSKGVWANFWFDANLTLVPSTTCYSSLSLFDSRAFKTFNVNNIECLLGKHPEILQNLESVDDGKSYFISTPFCYPFIYNPNGGQFGTVKYVTNKRNKK